MIELCHDEKRGMRRFYRGWRSVMARFFMMAMMIALSINLIHQSMQPATIAALPMSAPGVMIAAR